MTGLLAHQKLSRPPLGESRLSRYVSCKVRDQGAPVRPLIQRDYEESSSNARVNRPDFGLLRSGIAYGHAAQAPSSLWWE